MATKGNEPAYPNEYGLMEDLEGNVVNSSYVGLTKREQFAAIAMQALLTAEPDRKIDNIVKHAVDAAEALINALNK